LSVVIESTSAKLRLYKAVQSNIAAQWEGFVSRRFRPGEELCPTFLATSEIWCWSGGSRIL